MSLLTPGHISERTWPVTCHKTTKTGTGLLWLLLGSWVLTVARSDIALPMNSGQKTVIFQIQLPE